MGSASPEDRLDRAVRAVVDTPAGSLLVKGLSRAHQRWPEAQLVQRSVNRTDDALAEDGGMVTARLRFGGRVMVDARDADGRELLFEGELDPHATRLLERVAVPGWTFLDAGSRTGYFALLARRLGGPASVICAFESDSILGDHIAGAVARDGDPDGVLVVPARCGARADVGYGAGGPEVIVTIDEHCDTHGLVPDVVRLRADGHQLEAAEGMRRRLQARQPRFVLCSGGWRDDRGALERFFATYGYVARGIAADGALGDVDADPAATVCYARDAE